MLNLWNITSLFKHYSIESYIGSEHLKLEKSNKSCVELRLDHRLDSRYSSLFLMLSSRMTTLNFLLFHELFFCEIIIPSTNFNLKLKHSLEYLAKTEYNIIYVDWSILSPGPCYISAVYNTRHTGACVAQLVERILDLGSADIHVIGFSLGAQVPNFIARNLGSFLLPRITGELSDTFF